MQNIIRQYENYYKLHTFTNIKNPTRHESISSLYKKS